MVRGGQRWSEVAVLVRAPLTLVGVIRQAQPRRCIVWLSRAFVLGRWLMTRGSTGWSTGVIHVDASYRNGKWRAGIDSRGGSTPQGHRLVWPWEEAWEGWQVFWVDTTDSRALVYATAYCGMELLKVVFSSPGVSRGSPCTFKPPPAISPHVIVVSTW